jgi:hypothetical protein
MGRNSGSRELPGAVAKECLSFLQELIRAISRRRPWAWGSPSRTATASDFRVGSFVGRMHREQRSLVTSAPTVRFPLPTRRAGLSPDTMFGSLSHDRGRILNPLQGSGVSPARTNARTQARASSIHPWSVLCRRHIYRGW